MTPEAAETLNLARRLTGSKRARLLAAARQVAGRRRMMPGPILREIFTSGAVPQPKVYDNRMPGDNERGSE